MIFPFVWTVKPNWSGSSYLGWPLLAACFPVKTLKSRSPADLHTARSRLSLRMVAHSKFEIRACAGDFTCCYCKTRCCCSFIAMEGQLAVKMYKIVLRQLFAELFIWCSASLVECCNRRRECPFRTILFLKPDLKCFQRDLIRNEIWKLIWHKVGGCWTEMEKA